MRKQYWLTAVVILGGLVLAACGPAAQPPPGPEPKAPVATPAPKAGWEAKWNTVLAEAKKEGAVAVYTHWVPGSRIALSQAFKEKYGIDLEFSAFGGGADLLARANAEKRSGLYAADFFGVGVSSLLTNMNPEGLLGSIKPLLILPEVLDPNAWFGSRVPFPDEDGKAFAMVGMAMHMVVYNTGLIREGEITTYRDLLKPLYKGKIIMHDPSVSGSGLAAVTNIGHYLWGEEKTVDFLRRLIRDQEVVVQRDYRVHMESVARGKHAIGLAPTADLMAEFLSLGAPVKMADVEEDTILTASGGAFGVPTRFAHPNAATVFVNWLLTKEGQSILAKSMGNPSRRLDVSTEGINPLFILDPKKKYNDGDTEETLAAKIKWRGIARKVMDETMK